MAFGVASQILFSFKSGAFVKMIMLDASFIIELLSRNYENRWKIDDPMFVEAWLLDVVRS